MITSFPIIQNFQQSRKSHLKLQRESGCVNKLDYFRRKMVKNVKQSQNLAINNQTPQIQKDCLSLINKSQRGKDWVKSYSTQKYANVQRIKIKKSLQSQSRKNRQVLKKNFNRSKTDWQHNFVGIKYLNKIKQQLNKTRYQGGLKNEQKNISFSPILQKKSQSIQLINPKYSFNLKNQQKISNQQLERIKQYKQKRKIKVKQPVKLGHNQNKEQQEMGFNKVCNLFQKYEALEPWDDFSCNLSSVLFLQN